MPLSDGSYDVHFRQNDSLIETGSLELGANALVNRFILTTTEYGITPSSNLSTNVTNLQDFIDYVTNNNLLGVIDAGTWDVNSTLFLKNGTRLMGRGMHQTILNAPEGSWTPTDFYLFKLESSPGTNDKGLYLADMQCVGADKSRTDNGPLIRIEALYDGVIERIMVVDPSSYGIYITGYDYSQSPGYTDDITDPLWNNSHRVTVRDCLALRGQIGFGTEGNAENVLFQRCTAIGNYGLGDMDWGLHGYRSASGINIVYDSCRSFGYRNGLLLDRFRNVEVRGHYIEKCRNGIAYGSFYDSDPIISHDLRILGNYFHCEEENATGPRGINDFYMSNRRCDGVVIQGNTFRGDSSIRLGQTKNVLVQGNISTDGQASIVTSHAVTGLVTDNIMELPSPATGIVDGGNNIASNLT